MSAEIIQQTLARPLVAAIPAKDEAERIIGCLEALNGQVGGRLDAIVLLVNNSSDATAALARSVRLHPDTRLDVIECDLPPDQAHAGFARKTAMDHAAILAGPTGVLMTTDADGQVDPDWVAQTLAVLAAGADAVAGWVDLHPIEWGMIPLRLHEDDARECAYDALCDEITGLLYPDPADPLPRHTQHSGASIALTSAAYVRCGGVPALKSGEDRALIASLRRIDARIRHAPEVHVTVSGRMLGRAPGGMADTIRRRLEHPDEFLDERLEPAVDCAHRAQCRMALRRAYDGGALHPSLAERLELPVAMVERLLLGAHFGAVWDSIEAVSPALRRRRVAVAELPEQMRAARTILSCLRRTNSAASAAAAEIAG